MTYRFMTPCGLCGRDFQMGPHIYDGRWLGRYQMSICKICDAANWDGIGPVYEKKFELHLVERGLRVPARNGKGWYPLPS
jgi:hypothetical protein